MKKTCAKCGNEKKISEFTKDSRLKSGIASACAECKRKQYKTWATENSRNEYMREYNQRSGVREKRLAFLRSYSQTPKAKANREKYIEANKEKIRLREKQRYENDQYRLSLNISRRIRQSLSRNSKNGAHWETIVGFTRQDLKGHIESLFGRGMTWENYGEWHIDHKIPVSAFNFTKPEHEDFKRCWSLKNLQPMWAKENISKGAKLSRPFQPSLAI